MSFSKILRGLLFLLLGAFLLIQLVPKGRAHSNPAVTGNPPWDSPGTKAIFDRACADCHSNETHWPWYSNIAPVSWLIEKDVTEGRERFNVSEWGRPKNDADEAAEEVEKGAMPLPIYLKTHPEARLTPEEKATLIAGLKATFGEEKEHGEGGSPEATSEGGSGSGVGAAGADSSSSAAAPHDEAEEGEEHGGQSGH